MGASKGQEENDETRNEGAQSTSEGSTERKEKT